MQRAEVADAASVCGDASDIDAELARRVCDAVVNEIEPENLLREAVRPIEAALGSNPRVRGFRHLSSPIEGSRRSAPEACGHFPLSDNE